jgi:hypothetical protein
MNPAASFCEAFPRSIPFDNATLNSRITLGSWLVCAVTLFAAFLERTWSHVNYQRAPPENMTSALLALASSVAAQDAARMRSCWRTL